MRLSVSTVINTDQKQVWEKVKKKGLLMHVMFPMARFSLLNDDRNDEWEQGKTYSGWSFLFLIIPVGKRNIYIERIDENNYEIQSRESGEINLRKWDHLIQISENDNGTTKYTDTLEIDAGIFTRFYYLFAWFFYRHRQRRWRNLYK